MSAQPKRRQGGRGVAGQKLAARIGAGAPWYTSERQLARELECLFLRQWHFLAERKRVAIPGGNLGETLLDRSLVLRHAQDGVMRAFLNVCRHRGGPLVRDGESQSKTLKCLYHGWEYDESGRLKRTPQFSDTPKEDIDYDCYSLLPIRVAEWKGLIFVCLDPASPPLAAVLGDLPKLIGEFDATALGGTEVLTLTFSCNWKVYVENWLESYHLPWVHAGLAKDVRVSDYRVMIHDRVVQHAAGRRSEQSVYGGFWAWLAPNLGWNFYDCGLSLERIMPRGPHETEVRFTFLFRNDAPDEARQAAMNMTRRVTAEDGEMCEAVYRNMRSGNYRPGPLSPRHEHAVMYFHDYLVRTTGDACNSSSTKAGNAHRSVEPKH